jgi:O-antigen/teichoic acid export membrane protein
MCHAQNTTMRAGLIKSVGAQATGALFCAAISFALTLWLGRQLGTAAFGHYIWALKVVRIILCLDHASFFVDNTGRSYLVNHHKVRVIVSFK